MLIRISLSGAVIPLWEINVNLSSEDFLYSLDLLELLFVSFGVMRPVDCIEYSCGNFINIYNKFETRPIKYTLKFSVAAYFS